jgi:hypothetical protein
VLARIAGLDAVFLGGAVGALGSALVAAMILRQRD